MKTIILAGGLGTRFSEETESKPKPMIMINYRPILWHIVEIYTSQGFSDFVIATGYKSEVIEEWIDSLDTRWHVRAINTGLHTQTRGRLRAYVEEFSDQRFFATYGDGLDKVNLKRFLEFHPLNDSTITATSVHAPARFGYMEIENGVLTIFGEKNQVNEGWINGDFFVLNRDAVKQVFSDDEPFETGAFTKLSSMKQFYAYQHERFWVPMDTRNEQSTLTKLARQNPPPWKKV